MTDSNKPTAPNPGHIISERPRANQSAKFAPYAAPRRLAMGSMPLVVDNTISSFVLLKAELNKGNLANPNSAGRQLRAQALEKLNNLAAKEPTAAGVAQDWSNLTDTLRFAPTVSPGSHPLPAASAPTPEETIHDEVYNHFNNDWGNAQGGWFPGVHHQTFEEKIGVGFRNAIERAENTQGGSLPIDIIWVCSDPDPLSQEVYVEHVWNKHEVIVVIATPAPMIKADAHQHWTPDGEHNARILLEQSAAVSEVLEARIETFKANRDHLEELEIPVDDIIADLLQKLDHVPTTFAEAAEMDEEAETSAIRARMAVERRI
jgi:hypothetical protein